VTPRVFNVLLIGIVLLLSCIDVKSVNVLSWNVVPSLMTSVLDELNCRLLLRNHVSIDVMHEMRLLMAMFGSLGVMN